MPSLAEIREQKLEVAARGQQFSRSENRLLRYIIQCKRDRLVTCMGVKKMGKKNWDAIAERFSFYAKVLLIKSKTIESFPLEDTQLYQRPGEQLHQRQKTMDKAKKKQKCP